ncbi:MULTISPECIES: glycosyltransferase [Pseudoalteromonas]|uniref:Glycosyltransferase 2-like domain-containing protein n=1 Tax=Pseudoalteromonas amylolytica TaxID=1859457 RepID=A0A1S1MVA6_9GAMM|nr:MULTISPECIES: glycosyltransferase [Pseudoalteromonas]OHU90679.1 hypothetical protein BFC16_03495 [Pseudoalteromonas sp. JW3]OHU92700.1 hypothetical protein BET10_04395 [Pseudoalteromonas amylolytica]
MSKYNQAPLVSVLIISYNQEDFIAEAIESAVKQDYDNLEVIVADDGSTDRTVEIIQQYAEQYPKRVVPIVNVENLGITGNSNRGLAICKGKYIAFQGGDDVLLPGKISTQVQWLEADPKRVLCYHDMDVFLSETNETLYYQSHICKYHDGGAELIIKYGTYFGATTVMVRAPKQQVIFDSKIKIASDWLYWFEVVENQGGKIGRVDGVLARYRRHRNNITNNTSHILEEAMSTLNTIDRKYPQYHNLVQHKKSEIYFIDAYQSLCRGELFAVFRSVFKSLCISRGVWISPFKLIFNKLYSTKVSQQLRGVKK